ncbi:MULTISPECIES: DUF5667 domain-containing protein [Micromonospora]|uniref:DUF5667 domain-containing protein n=1 Tax=Micromonospora TaxID=1873 RepID=UPI0003EEAAA3|nr:MULTISPECIES: DUF5667 domain-containing protein [unclassified Micromonospora]EWM67321.1 hypothetical protein MCBG_04454 [Micromonospora sp. M42]MCK1808076.1 DUF5667 domain-containing protein [Micromonospora sp. R42106]MCK1832771.1 DUF5667 domain-containing protein [Micromonospora sp. R42003]MCK1845005.1 DUF5667 domain-containing protein [Micromonospora sp. R42004]MCM1016854.1 DUF5667 domain-containing protein [Micromonospora sp. XM-20-01]
MDSDLFSRRRAERFAQLLDEANGGRRHHVRSKADGELTALVEVSRRLSAERPDVEPGAEFRTGLRAMLVATAEREGVGTPAKTTTGVRGTLLPAITGRRARARGAILVGVAAGAVALSGISAASENALPGDALYGMKRSTERAQLALASSDISRGQLFLDFARTRLDEAASVRGDRLGFSAVLDDMDADTRQGVRLLTTVAAQRSDPVALDAVDTFLAGQRRVVSGLLDRPDHAERDRTRRSLALLDAAGKRADALREAIACGLPAPQASDALGPAPAACPADR